MSKLGAWGMWIMKAFGSTTKSYSCYEGEKKQGEILLLNDIIIQEQAVTSALMLSVSDISRHYLGIKLHNV